MLYSHGLRLVAAIGLPYVYPVGFPIELKASDYEIPGHPGKGLARCSWAGWHLGLVPLRYPGEGLAGRSWAGWLLGLIPLGYPGG